MTDKEKLVTLLTEFGVGFREVGGDIMCCQGDAGIDGYSSFFTNFEFDDAGKFTQMGAWE